MKTTPIELGSVHPTKNGMRELESCLMSLAESPDIEIQIKSSGFIISGSRIEEIIEHGFIKNEARAYDIRFRCEKGKLRIVADCDSDEHLLYLNGESEWEQRAEYRLTRFMDVRKSIWRSFIGGREARWLEVGFAISLSSSLGLFLPSKMLHPQISGLDIAVLVISVVGLFAANQRNRVYPYFSVSFGKTPQYPDLFPLLVPLGFSLGIVMVTL